MRKGILSGGNWIIDEVSMIDSYPAEENLVNIIKGYSSNGGSAYNILKDLSRLGASFPLEGIGLIGEDERGQRIIDDCRRCGISTDQIGSIQETNTSYTYVMTVQSSGKRTFFHRRGANALLNESHFDFSLSNCKIFHLGYLLLLDALDIPDEQGITGAARVFEQAKRKGFITSADTVSEHSDRFRSVIIPSLAYIDYLFLNEYEAMKVSGITTSIDGKVMVNACVEAALQIKSMGVGEWVILHFASGIIAVRSAEEIIYQACIDLPLERIIGTVGAGDAVAAGVLLGIHEGWSMTKSVELGACAAASCVLAATSSDGILSHEECLLFPNTYGFKKIL